MRGHPRKAELLPEAQELRAQGLTYREIGERLGVASSQAIHAWFSDPDLAKQRARRKRYAGACVDCGTAKSGPALARAYECSTTAIYCRLRKAGAAMRPAGGRRGSAA